MWSMLKRWFSQQPQPEWDPQARILSRLSPPGTILDIPAQWSFPTASTALVEHVTVLGDDYDVVMEGSSYNGRVTTLRIMPRPGIGGGDLLFEETPRVGRLDTVRLRGSQVSDLVLADAPIERICRDPLAGGYAALVPGDLLDEVLEQLATRRPGSPLRRQIEVARTAVLLVCHYHPAQHGGSHARLR